MIASAPRSVSKKPGAVHPFPPGLKFGAEKDLRIKMVAPTGFEPVFESRAELALSLWRRLISPG